MEKNNSISIKNRKASFEYNILTKYEAGIALIGHEIKAIRENGATISDAYCYVNNGEIFVKNMHISNLKNATTNTHDPLRDRKLLLNKKEIRKITESISKEGLTVVPLSLFTNKKGLVKLEIAVCKGKKLYDKRESIKKKDVERSLKRQEI